MCTPEHTPSAPKSQFSPQLMETRRRANRAYAARQRAAAKAYVDAIREKTVCAECGAQPIEWHHDDHPQFPKRRIASMVGRALPVGRIQEEIDRCVALCRRCHMAKDGRSAQLTANGPCQKGSVLPTKNCTACGRPYKPMRRGLCNRCSHKARRASAENDNCASQLRADDRGWDDDDDSDGYDPYDDDRVPTIVVVGGWPEEDAS